MADARPEIAEGGLNRTIVSGDLDRAGALASSIPDPALQEQALTYLAMAVARSGDFDRAEILARST